MFYRLSRIYHCWRLYSSLRGQFSDIRQANAFFVKWRDELGQVWMGEEFSLRSMAYHCGRVLQGYRVDPELDRGETYYLEVPEAIDIYNGVSLKTEGV